MAVVLALEPDLRQATVLKRVIKEHVGAELTVVDSRDDALAAIAERMPDVILLTALLSPRDEEELFARLRATPGAEHVQTHTIPQLASAASPHADDRGATGMLGRLRRKKAEPEPLPGCDPKLFADEVLMYLQRSAELRTAGGTPRPQEEIKAGAHPVEPRALTDSPRETAEDPSASAGSAWASPFEWRPSSEGRGGSRSAPVVPDAPAAPAMFDDVEDKIARAAQREADLAAERIRFEADREAERRIEAEHAAEREQERIRVEAERQAERQRIEKERAAEREKERTRVEAEREAERIRVEAEREKERLRVQTEREAERRRVETERQKIEAERKKIEAERQREAAEREKERLRVEADRQRLEAEAAAARRREAERLREEAAKEKERLRKQAEQEKERLRAEAERKRIEAEREAERVRVEAAREAERLRLEAERQRLEAERHKKDAEQQRLEAERQKAAAERERQHARLEAERQKLEAERMRQEAERVRLEAAREAERLREEARLEAERLRAQAEEEAQRARAEEGIAAAKTQEEARGRRDAEKARKRSAERARRHNEAVQDAFAAFREDPVERPRGAARLVPLAIWARLEQPGASAPDKERDELRELMKGLSIPPHVAGVAYARGCRIRRVRVPAAKTPARAADHKTSIILSKKALQELRDTGAAHE